MTRQVTGSAERTLYDLLRRVEALEATVGGYSMTDLTDSLESPWAAKFGVRLYRAGRLRWLRGSLETDATGSVFARLDESDAPAGFSAAGVCGANSTAASLPTNQRTLIVSVDGRLAFESPPTATAGGVLYLPSIFWVARG